MRRFHTFRRPLLFILILLGTFLLTAAAMSQTAPADTAETLPAGPTVNIDTVKAMIESAETLDDEAKTQVLDRLKPALVDLQQAQAARDRIAEMQAEIDNVPKRLSELRTQLQSELSLPELPENLTPETVDAELDAAQAELAAARQQLQQLEGEPARRKQRLLELPKEQQQASADALIVREELADLPEATNGDPRVEAKRVALAAKLSLFDARAKLTATEMRYIEATSERLQLRQDVLARRVPHLEKVVEFWRQQADRVRSAQTLEIVRTVRQQRKALAEADPRLVALAEENVELVQGLQGGQALPRRIDRARRDLADTRQRLATLRANRDEIDRRVEIVGLNESVGALLRQQRSRLPNATALDASIQDIQQRLTEVRLRSLEFQARRADLADTQTRARELLAGWDNAPGVTVADVSEVLDKRREVLDELIDGQDTLAQELSELQQATAELRTQAAAFRDYIEERVLWIRSVDVIGLTTLISAGRGLGAMFSPERWSEVARALWTGLTSRIATMAVWLAVIGALLARRRHARRRLEALAEQGQQRHGAAFVATLRALAWMGYLAALLPTLLWMLSVILANGGSVGVFARVVSQVLGSLAWTVLALTVVYRVAAPAGLLRGHLKWDRARVVALRRGVYFALWCIMPTAFFARLGSQIDGGAFHASLGRLGAMLVMLEVTALAAWLARPGGAWLRRDAGHPAGRLARYRWVVMFLAFGVPLVMAVLPAFGYLYTVQAFATILRREVWLIVAAVMTYPLLMRGVFLARRDMARRRITEQQARAEGEQDEAVADRQLRESLEEVSATSESVARLVALLTGLAVVAGTLWIFRSVLPALGVLDRVALWLVAEGEVVSLRDVLGGIVTLVIVVYASRSLPGLFDAFVLQRLGMDRGQRYALSTVMRYVLVGVGVALVAEFLGVRWANLQWIVAALGVGLGFGLQEIFGNFVSGLILLAERPIRVGDMVTVGEVTGMVSRIQIRATTVVDFDRKELIIPNKTFVTGQLINWSLSDRKARVVIPVGVAYGSDTELARTTLLEVAKANPSVLDEPPATAFFLGFGASSLDFQLRVFIGDTDELFKIRHELHMAIDAAFREKHITIAFPQQDVHMFFDDREGLDRLAGRDVSPEESD